MSSPSVGLRGQIERRGKRTVIEVNAEEARVDQRFIVARAIGHACLGHLNDQTIRRDFSAHAATHAAPLGPIDVQTEREANRFAGAFLMPKFVVDTLMRSGSVTSLFAFAERLGVSHKAAAVRLKQLDWM